MQSSPEPPSGRGRQREHRGNKENFESFKITLKLSQSREISKKVEENTFGKCVAGQKHNRYCAASILACSA